jgi:hypothetical protein
MNDHKSDKQSPVPALPNHWTPSEHSAVISPANLTPAPPPPRHSGPTHLEVPMKEYIPVPPPPGSRMEIRAPRLSTEDRYQKNLRELTPEQMGQKLATLATQFNLANENLLAGIQEARKTDREHSERLDALLDTLAATEHEILAHVRHEERDDLNAFLHAARYTAYVAGGETPLKDLKLPSAWSRTPQIWIRKRRAISGLFTSKTIAYNKR